MAVAEARAAWQRTANRCLVQEDAKRAPKLACCPSSPSVKQVDSGPANQSDGQDGTSLGFLPYKQNPSHFSLSPNARWWLQHQPDYGYQRAFANEQLNSPETEMKSIGSNDSSFVKVSGKDDFKIVDESTYMDLGARTQKPEVISDYYEIKDSKKVNETCFDSESDWLTEPWWRTADKDELAHLVAQRSLSLVENCDLPQPQKGRIKKDLSRFDHDYERGKLISRSSISTKHEQNLRAEKSMAEPPVHDEDPSKARLLEALRHSQTRAREAEIAAKRAYEDKEHIVKLVFRQASQIFAYKQWFQLLQLENLYVHIKNSKKQKVNYIVPVMLPSLPRRSKKIGKNRQKKEGKEGKRGRGKYDIGKYAVVFAVGLSLVGAGLLLGWTVGWMLPTF